MELRKIRDLNIAKNKIDFVFGKNEELNYHLWVEFVNLNSDYFIWKEDTEEGKEILKNIDSVPENFKERVLKSCNRVICYSDFDTKKNYFNVNAGFNSENNWITIGFERDPNKNDLKRFLAMAEHLGALLLNNGQEIINDKTIENL